jgi:hypothetical protein
VGSDYGTAEKPWDLIMVQLKNHGFKSGGQFVHHYEKAYSAFWAPSYYYLMAVINVRQLSVPSPNLLSYI